MSDKLYTCENVNGISYDWNGQVFDVTYTEEEVQAVQALHRYIFNGEQKPMTSDQLEAKINNVKSILKKSNIDVHLIKFIIERAIHIWFCYCTKVNTQKNKCLFEKSINKEILIGIINKLFSTRERGNAVTKRAPNEERIEKLKLNIQNIRNTLDKELKIKLAPKRRISPKNNPGQVPIKNESDEESDEESEEFEDMVLRF